MVNKNFSPAEQGGIVRVTDRRPAYFMGGDVGMEDHQVCIAHLLGASLTRRRPLWMTPGVWTCLTSCGTPCTGGIRGRRGGTAEEDGGAAG